MQEAGKKFTIRTKLCPDFCGICITERGLCILLYEVSMLKEDEKKKLPWEAVDPKPPVIRSGHLENWKQ